jgi:hypothetical protein
MPVTPARDGLIGMYGYEADAEGNVTLQFQVISKSYDVYIVQAFDPLDWNNPKNCIPLSRQKVLGMNLYQSTQAVDRALGRPPRSYQPWDRPAPRRVSYLAILRAAEARDEMSRVS